MDNLVTVFRSADSSAEEDAAEVIELLSSEGISATLLNDEAPGVPEGTWEVRVEAAEAPRAEQLIAENPIEDEFESPDESSDLDFVTVFRSGDGSNEMEAMNVKNVLEANGIYATLVGGDVPIPSLSQEVRVAKDHVDDAKRVIADALAAGSKGAEEAEADGEPGI